MEDAESETPVLRGGGSPYDGRNAVGSTLACGSQQRPAGKSRRRCQEREEGAAACLSLLVWERRPFAAAISDVRRGEWTECFKRFADG